MIEASAWVASCGSLADEIDDGLGEQAFETAAVGGADGGVGVE